MNWKHLLVLAALAPSVAWGQARVVAQCGSLAPFGPQPAGSTAYVTQDTNGQLCLAGGGSGGGSTPGVITPDASNLASQKNGTSAQAFRVYNTWTDASNGEWGALDWQTTPNVLTIGTQKNGTGTARAVKIVSNGTDALLLDTDPGPGWLRLVARNAKVDSNVWAVGGYLVGAGATAGVSCAAGTVSVATMVVTLGIVTHC